MIKFRILILFLLASFTVLGATGNKKYERTMARADAFYESFAYRKAIKLYEEALDIQDNQEPKLQIANSYRNLNQASEAKLWYEKALADGPLADEDMLHYGQILSTLEKYDSAHMILEKYQNKEEWVGDRAEGFRNVSKFFINEMAYDINEFAFNSVESDFSPTLKQDETVVFVSGRPFKGMLKPKYQADKSLFLNLFEIGDEGPVQLERGINTRYHEGPSQFYSNDTKVLFTRNNYNNHSADVSEEGVNHLKIYESSVNEKGTWSKPVELAFNSDEYSVGHPALSPDEQTLYFGSDMPGGFGGVDLYKTTLVNGKWSTPQNLGPTINTARDEMFPYVSANGFLYFSSDGHEGIGGLDVFRVDLTRDNSNPRNMGFALNSNKDDFGIVLDREKGNKGYFSSNRDGGTGDDDIYEVLIYDHIITVNLRDAKTKELIEGDLKAIDITLDEVIRDQSGVSSVQFPAIHGDIFTAYGAAPQYVADTLRVVAPSDSRELRPLSFDIFLKKKGGKAIVYVVNINEQAQQVLFKQESDSLTFHDGAFADLKESFSKDYIEVDSVIYLNNVLYDFDKHNIREDAAGTLDQWVAFLNQYEDKNISLSSHTDARGTTKYNERLAKKRVKSAVKYLIKAGISKDRFVEKSYGEETPWESCEEADCDEVQHQNNRRTEILIEVK